MAVSAHKERLVLSLGMLCGSLYLLFHDELGIDLSLALRCDSMVDLAGAHRRRPVCANESRASHKTPSLWLSETLWAEVSISLSLSFSFFFFSLPPSPLDSSEAVQSDQASPQSIRTDWPPAVTAAQEPLMLHEINRFHKTWGELSGFDTSHIRHLIYRHREAGVLKAENVL